MKKGVGLHVDDLGAVTAANAASILSDSIIRTWLYMHVHVLTQDSDVPIIRVLSFLGWSQNFRIDICRNHNR
jgi:hypothetical protein